MTKINPRNSITYRHTHPNEFNLGGKAKVVMAIQNIAFAVFCYNVFWKQDFSTPLTACSFLTTLTATTILSTLTKKGQFYVPNR